MWWPTVTTGPPHRIWLTLFLRSTAIRILSSGSSRGDDVMIGLDDEKEGIFFDGTGIGGDIDRNKHNLMEGNTSDLWDTFG